MSTVFNIFSANTLFLSLFWVCIALLAQKKPIIITPDVRFMLAAVIILTAPLLYAQASLPPGATLHVGCLLVGLILWGVSETRGATLLTLLAQLYTDAIGFFLKSQQALAKTDACALEYMTALKALQSLLQKHFLERVAFYEQVNALLVPPAPPRLHEQYFQWAKNNLTHRINKNVYVSMSLIKILLTQKRQEGTGRYSQNTERLFPQNRRFEGRCYAIRVPIDSKAEP